MKILQVGLGGFGKNHLKAWIELGFHSSLFVCDLNPLSLKICRELGLPADRIASNYKEFIDKVDIIDVVTDTLSHFEIAQDALNKNLHVFVEKPLTLTAIDSLKLFELSEKKKKALQVGYYYRYHPISIKMKELLPVLGNLRYIRGEFMGFKRARKDVGVMHTDGIHFIDLCNWLLSDHPKQVFALTRDHFGRGLEDLAIGLFYYNNNIVSKIEAGYIQPGLWKDKVVPHAMTTKTFSVIGSHATLTADFETEQLQLFQCHHELQDGTWTLVNRGSEMLPVSSAHTVDLVKKELSDFINQINCKKQSHVNALDSGFKLGKTIEAFYESSRKSKIIEISLNT